MRKGDATMAPLIIGLVIVGVLVLVAVGLYNSLVKATVRVDEAWSDITVQLKRRYDLIPNLVETVKGYAKHEKETFDTVIKARNAALNAMSGGSPVAETAKAENQFEGALKSLFALSENYPDLKANQNFLQLQDELVDSEDKIQAARRFYNSAVRDLNIRVKTIPSSIIAGMLHIKEREFFELDESEMATVQKPVDVKF
jgi:LemA protein